MALGLTQPLTGMITRNICWVKEGRYVGLTTLPPSCADCQEILGVLTSWNLYRDKSRLLYTFFREVRFGRYIYPVMYLLVILFDDYSVIFAFYSKFQAVITPNLTHVVWTSFITNTREIISCNNSHNSRIILYM
jgi:hypothetical protein